MENSEHMLKQPPAQQVPHGHPAAAQSGSSPLPCLFLLSQTIWSKFQLRYLHIF